jgi:hypothetical protein
MNRTGRVLRWGNGWVSVTIDSLDDHDDDDTIAAAAASDTTAVIKKQKNNKGGGGGNISVEGTIHNRRSFELFLHPDQQDGKEKEEEPPQQQPR